MGLNIVETLNFASLHAGAEASALTRYGNQLVPFVLIGLGVVIPIKSHTKENPGLAVLSLVLSCFCLIAQNRHIWQTAEGRR